MADNKVVVAGLVVYFQILVFYAMIYFGIVGSRPAGISDCYSYPQSDRAYTKNELKIRAIIEGRELKNVENVSEQFNMLIAFGFWIQFILFVTEITQMFYRTKRDDEDDDTFQGYKTGVNRYMEEREAKKREKTKIMNIILALIRTACIVLQVIYMFLLFLNRLSHNGQVCAGALLNADQLKNKDITRSYEMTKGLFLKAVIVYYLILLIGIVVLMFGALLIRQENKDELKRQKEFNERAAQMFQAEQIESSSDDLEKKELIKIPKRKDTELTETNPSPHSIQTEKRQRRGVVVKYQG